MTPEETFGQLLGLGKACHRSVPSKRHPSIVGRFPNKSEPGFSTEGLRKMSEMCSAEKRGPASAKSLPAADPSDELLEGVPEETQDQQEKAGQDTDHRGNCSGAQTRANVG